MKLKLFNTETICSYSKREEIRRIRFNSRGLIYISGGVAELINLKKGDRLSLAQDEERPNDWYLFKSHNGFLVGRVKNAKSFSIHSRGTVEAFNNNFKMNGHKSYSIPVGNELIDGMLPLITSALKNKS